MEYVIDAAHMEVARILFLLALVAAFGVGLSYLE